MSVTQIWQRLSVGGIGDAESNPIEITTVVTPCRETVKKFAPGVNYLYFPLRDARPIPVGRFDGIIDALWENIRWGKVLVHSFDGADQAPIVAAAWMHIVGCKDIDAALADIGRLRSMEPNPVLITRVKGVL